MSLRRIKTNGNIHQRKDTGDYIGVVWYVDDDGKDKRKSFSAKTKSEVQQKITNYIAEFNQSVEESDESRKKLKDSMQSWLEVFKFPSVERTTYDRLESTARIHVYPALGDKVVSTVKAAGIEQKGLHSLRHTFATNLVNGVKQPDGTIKCLTPRQAGDLLGHSTS